jgi:baculoviral IAP repeat-containing protein 6
MEEESETVRQGDGLRDEPELICPSSSTACSDLLAYQPLTLVTLRSLRQLTRCANLTPCFTANAPACWSEMMQAQKQRRHPQHLQQGGEELHHTRTWRLQHERLVN